MHYLLEQVATPTKPTIQLCSATTCSQIDPLCLRQASRERLDCSVASLSTTATNWICSGRTTHTVIVFISSPGSRRTLHWPAQTHLSTIEIPCSLSRMHILKPCPRHSFLGFRTFNSLCVYWFRLAQNMCSELTGFTDGTGMGLYTYTYVSRTVSCFSFSLSPAPTLPHPLTLS